MSTHYPRFQEAIKVHKTSLSLPTGTYWRYLNGHLPAFGRLITECPDLAQALAEDAAALAAARAARAGEARPNADKG